MFLLWTKQRYSESAALTRVRDQTFVGHCTWGDMYIYCELPQYHTLNICTNFSTALKVGYPAWCAAYPMFNMERCGGVNGVCDVQSIPRAINIAIGNTVTVIVPSIWSPLCINLSNDIWSERWFTEVAHDFESRKNTLRKHWSTKRDRNVVHQTFWDAPGFITCLFLTYDMLSLKFTTICWYGMFYEIHTQSRLCLIA